MYMRAEQVWMKKELCNHELSRRTQRATVIMTSKTPLISDTLDVLWLSSGAVLLTTVFLRDRKDDVHWDDCCVGLAVGTMVAFSVALGIRSNASSIGTDTHVVSTEELTKSSSNPNTDLPPVLDCIRARRSVFPRDYVDEKVPPQIINRLLDAAMWAPYHGSVPPWYFVVMGAEASVQMQQQTLEFYDAHWREVGYGSGERGTESDYEKWREMTEEEIHDRWKPVSYMVAIVMRRQAGSKRIPEWEEAAATACAVQNMHLQSTVYPGLACYWSSWHDAARDSTMMKEFLGMEDEDKCLGFFMVARCKANLKDIRQARHRCAHIEFRE